MASLAPNPAIATQCDKCYASFNQLVAAVQNTPPDSTDPPRVIESLAQDEVGRFRVWLGTVGAHKPGRLSLDYRLREAANTRDSVLELLKDLEYNVLEACEVVSGQRLPYDKIASDSSSSESEVDEKTPDEKSTTELEQTMSDIHDIVSCLYEITTMLRDPTPQDKLLKLATIDVSEFEQWDKMRIRQEFPKAHSTLTERLAQANSKRRQNYQYSKECHDKVVSETNANILRELPRRLSGSGGNWSDKTSVELGPRSITAKRPTTVATKDTKATVDTFQPYEQDTYVDDTFSETSSAASEGISEPNQLPIPSPPQAASDGDSFKCPYCFEKMKISSSLVWRMHVLRDLQPYVCTFIDCTQPQRTYGSRHEWFLHEAQHRRQWSCIYCTRTFPSEKGFSDHIKQDHPTACPSHQLQVLIDMCVKPVDNQMLGQCPLCLKEGQQLRSHLARHLRTIALFVLPRTINIDREDAKSHVVQSGISVKHEEADANIERLFDSDHLLDVSDDAMIGVPKIKPSLLTPLESTQDSPKLKPVRFDSAAPTLYTPRPKSRSETLRDNARVVFDKTIDGHYRHGKTGYRQVGALFLTWADDDMQCKDTEVDKLRDIFKDQFHFKTEHFEIPSERWETALHKRLSEFCYEYDSPEDLAIIYYAGHAYEGTETREFKLAAKFSNEDGLGDPTAFFNDVQTCLRLPRCDQLMILDCCYAAKAFIRDHVGKRKFELLVSSSHDQMSPAPHLESSFTRALCETMKRLIKQNPTGFCTSHLYREVYHSMPATKPSGKPSPKPLLFDQARHSLGQIWLRPQVLDDMPRKALEAGNFLKLTFRLNERPDLAVMNELALQLQYLPHVDQIRFENLYAPKEHITDFMRLVFLASKLKPLVRKLRARRERRKFQALAKEIGGRPAASLMESFLETTDRSAFNWSSAAQIKDHQSGYAHESQDRRKKRKMWPALREPFLAADTQPLI